ncbi:MAG: hypothetical protein IPM48_05685 [Saprospiraceae bacterium]|nr:hypothetical protein [Saprospiraceae bacterium]
MKTIFQIVVGLMAFTNVVNSQYFVPLIDESRKATESLSESPTDVWEMNLSFFGGFRETGAIKQEELDKINGSAIINFHKSDKFNFTIGYTLNKINTNGIATARQYFYSILVPDLGGQAFSANFIRKWKDKKYFQLNFSIGNDLWEINGTEYEASPYSVRLNYIYKPFDQYELDGENFFDMRLELGACLRGLSNNILDQRDVLKTNFGMDRTNFFGLEANVVFTFNKFSLFFHPSIIFASKVDGFPNRGLYLFGALVQGDALSFKLNKKQ